MRSIKHTLTLRGTGCRGDRPTPDAVGSVLALIKPMVRQSVHMGFLHSSRTSGRPLKALAEAWDIRYAGLDEGPDESTRLHFESRLFGEAAHEIYAQTQLWEDAPAANETGMDLLGYALSDVAQSVKESNRYDSAFLSKVTRFSQVFKKGVDSLEVAGHHLVNNHTPPIVEEHLIQAAKELYRAIPRPKRVRVQGTLDMIRISDCTFELVLRHGERLRAVRMDQGVEPLAQYLNKAVMIEGEAVFRPSGSLLRVDVRAIAQAAEADALFSRMPEPTASRLRIEDFRQHQSAKTGFNAIAGAWPGDENIDELLAALEEIG